MNPHHPAPLPQPEPSSNIVPFAPGQCLPAITGKDYEPLFRTHPSPPTVQDVMNETRTTLMAASRERGIELDPRETALAIEIAVQAYRRGCEHAAAELANEWRRQYGPTA